MEKKVYKLRNPQGEDLFLIIRILSKIGIKNVKGCFESADVKAAINAMQDNNESDMTAVGISVAFDVAGLVLEHLDGAKKDIYALLSRLSGLDEKEIAEMEMADFAGLVIEVVKLEGFRDFFRQVVESFK